MGEGSSGVDVRNFGAKIDGFFEIYGVSERTRRLSYCGHFVDKGRGWSIFLDFVRTSLCTTPYLTV